MPLAGWWYDKCMRESFVQKGIEGAKKAARIGVTGLAMTGGPSINVPIPAEITGLQEAALETLQYALPKLRGTIHENPQTHDARQHAEETKDH